MLSWNGYRDHVEPGTFDRSHELLSLEYQVFAEIVGGQPPVESLAGLTEPGSFTTQDLRRFISEARKLRRRRKSPPGAPNDPSADDHPTVPYNPMVAYEAVPGHQVTHQPVVSSQPVQPGAPKSSPTAAPREPGTPNRRESAAGGSQDRVENLLNLCANQLATQGYPGLAESLAVLDRQIADPEFQRHERRRRYWDIITKNRLLVAHRFAFLTFPDLYYIFLRAAFGQRPLNYEDYCAIEESLESAPHMDLMEAIKRIGVTDIHTKAIVYQGIGAETLMEEFRNGKSDLRDLIDSVATVELKRIHLRLIADIIIRALNDTRMMRKRKISSQICVIMAT